MTSLSTRRARPTRRRWSALTAAALLAVVLAGCGDDDEQDGTATDPAPTSATRDETDADPEVAGGLPAWAPVIETDATGAVTGLDFTDTPEPGDDLLVATVEEGDGAPVEVGQTITANYFGSVYQGETPFDESFSSQPFQAPIGVGRLIPGWDESIPGIAVGSRIVMAIPSDLGYGDAGQPPTIPGGATLYFVIDILDAA